MTTVLDRFLKYVAYDTQSREGAEVYPSTPGQLVLLGDLVKELLAIGVTDAAIDEHGYVTATLATFFVARDAEDDDGELAGHTAIEALRQEIAALRTEVRALGERATGGT